jgi:hypothetical protein
VTIRVSGYIVSIMATASGSKAATNRVRQHRATAGMIRVEVEVPTREDALAVRRFAQARRRSKDKVPAPIVDAPAASTTAPRDELIAILADMDTVRQAIALLFSHALAQTTDPDTMERGRCVALNFADAVARHRRDMALGDDGSQVR